MFLFIIDYMEKIKFEFNNRNIKRILMTTLGVLLGGFAVGFFNVSGFGADPFQVFVQGINNYSPLDFGTTYFIVNALELILVFFMDKKKIGLGTVINICLLGYVVDFSESTLRNIVGCGAANPSMLIRVIFLLIGIVIISLSAAIYFVPQMGVSTHDAISLYISEKQSKVKFQYCRIINDVIDVVIGVLLGAKFGVGTLVAAFGMGPLIAFFRRTVAEPMLNGRKK